MTTTHTGCINKLAGALRPYGWNDQSIDGYLIALADLPVEALQDAVAVTLRTTDHMPAPAALRKMILRATVTDRPPHVDAAWNEVAAQMSTVGAMGRPTWSHPLIGAAVRESCQWSDMCRSQFVDPHRKAFGRTYTRMVDDAERAMLVANRFTPQVSLDERSGGAHHALERMTGNHEDDH